MGDWRDPIHPGEILAEEIKALGISVLQFSKRLDVPNNRIYQILVGRRGISADTALRLGKFFDVEPEFWLNLQKSYELEVARQGGVKLDKIEPLKRETPAVLAP